MTVDTAMLRLADGLKLESAYHGREIRGEIQSALRSAADEIDELRKLKASLTWDGKLPVGRPPAILDGSLTHRDREDAQKMLSDERAAHAETKRELEEMRVHLDRAWKVAANTGNAASRRTRTTGSKGARDPRAKEAGMGEPELLRIIDSLVDWALANRGSKHEFVRCYTYDNGEIPDVIRDAKRVLKRAATQRRPRP